MKYSMSGLVQRGENSWRIHFDVGTDPLTGKRKRHFQTFRGTKKEAKAERARLMSEAKRGNHVDPSKITVSEFFDLWDRDWATSNLSPKTIERHREYIRVQIKPNIGAERLQKLRTVDLAALYAKLLREGSAKGRPLAARTVSHVHKLLHRALGHAAKWSMVQQNVAAIVDPPKVAETEIESLSDDQANAVLRALKGATLYPIVATALATGMRRGEVLALRWQDVDFDGATIHVEQSVEETEGGKSLRLKAPKTKRGRRNIALPSYLVGELRAHWKAQQELRLKLGVGGAAPDDLVFASVDGGPRKPNSVTREWSRLVVDKKLPKVSFHALRHTHVSQLIASGMDVLTISRRIGHSSPTITLSVYGHLFKNTDAEAANVIEKAFGNIATTE